MRLRALAFVLASTFALAVPAAVERARAAKPKGSRQREDDPLAKAKNLLNVASLLLRDGHIDRAATVLAEIDVKTKKLPLARYYTLAGLIALKRGDHTLAARKLKAAIENGQKNHNAYLLLAQARYGAKDYRGTLAALGKSGKLASSYAGIFAMRAICQRRLGQRGEAWRALSAGIQAFPKARDLQRQKVLLMVELGLYQQATRLGLRFLARGETTAQDYVAIAEALRGAKQQRRAILILEQARLQHPKDDVVLKQLARSYLDDGKPLAAAELLARAAHRRPKYRVEAAELYRRAGKLLSALYLNEQAIDQRAKVRQRLGLMIELSRFEAAVALAPRLSRLGLLADQPIVYALAYACYKTGDFARAERWLGRLTEPTLFARAIQLRKAMQSCKAIGWACH
jgi:tetratricopeptide (TPR) repeat protein